MRRLVATWLTISMPLCVQPALAATEPPPDDLPTQTTDLVNDLVPPAPPWPSGLPSTVRGPAGTLLPPELAHAVHGRLLYLDRYPGLCRTAVRQMARVDHLDCQADLAVQAVQAQAASDKRSASAEAHRLTVGKVLGIGVVSAALGALAVLIAVHH